MPLAVSFLPKHTCASFPLCHNPQTRKKSGLAGSRQRSDYCDLCLSTQPACSIKNCTRRAVPSTGRYATDLCVLHYSDPLHSDRRNWALRCNSRAGCRHLSQTPRTGKCFACQAGHVPCAHSLAGCPAHTRSTAKPLPQRPSCAPAHARKCSFDPTNSSKCSTRLCGQPRASPTATLCSDCALERLPCWRLCSRRSSPSPTTSDRLCDLCAAPPCAQGASVEYSASINVTAIPPPGDALSQQSPKYACFNFPFCRKSQKDVFCQSFTCACF